MAWEYTQLRFVPRGKSWTGEIEELWLDDKQLISRNRPQQVSLVDGPIRALAIVELLLACELRRELPDACRLLPSFLVPVHSKVPALLGCKWFLSLGVERISQNWWFCIPPLSRGNAEVCVRWLMPCDLR